MSVSWTAPGRLRTAPPALSAVGLAACLLAGCATAGGSGAAPGPSPEPEPDWPEATYSVTCDGIVPGGFEADLDGGAARVPADASRSPFYEYYDVWFEASASGDVDGDGEPDTVVLLQCSPQPSNGILEEVQVFAADGTWLGLLPSPRTLRESTILSPLYDPTALSVRDGDIVAGMRAYAPEDNRADGPSIPVTVRWHWNGRDFVRVP
ncbi:hypothetical protein [Geodermatophilus sabuli]|uniref:Lipoprotein n=1 Tax=Geodermatophilus sabuli TaxID=1564158 RepID=A0A285EHJ2_9ACTN|nr:hypothetical protein [Geodermatophilus sabuli]MBB3086684.1 hypothetical protein [Geodermatophilus sabuli]SNX97664.1 hypothetical protein SAMN06893097_10829 [Geodermatophilus sabuli]